MIPLDTPESPGSIAGIPDPIPGEPPDLRRAILDEIADHLHCATQRELRRAHSTSSGCDRAADQSSDPAAGGAAGEASDPASDSTSDPDLDSARRRAIDRFGDPAAIARRLWFDAMKGQLETLMTNRILIGFNIVLLLAVLVLGGLLVVMVRDGRAFHRELVERMMIQEASARGAREAENASTISPETSLEAARIAASYDWPSIDVEVVDEETDAPIGDVQIRLLGEAYAVGKSIELRVTTDANGVARFGPMRPGSYRGTMEPRDRLPIQLGFLTVRPGPSNRQKVRVPSAPDPAPVPVVVDVTWPESVTDPNTFLFVRFTAPTEKLGESQFRDYPAIDAVIRRDGSSVMLPADFGVGGLNFETMTTYLSDENLKWNDSIVMLQGVQYEANGSRAAVFAPASDAEQLEYLSNVTAHEGFDSPTTADRERPLSLSLIERAPPVRGRR